MRKKSLITLGVVSLFIITGITAHFTHALEFYTVSTTSNLPTYKTGDWIIASALKQPDDKKFLVFEKDKNYWIFRCIGKEGDLIEMKESVLYVNGKLLNEPYTTKEYHLTTKEVVNMSGYLTKNDISAREVSFNSSLVALSDDQLKELNKNLKRFSKPKGGTPAEHLYPQFKKMGYNEDNFGPIKVPKNSFFVLGDNRHDAFDSRYFGFVKAGEVISTVLF
jgi:signal peptidase I